MAKISSTFVSAALTLYFCSSLFACAYGQTLVFGPEFFSNTSGEPQRVVKSFSVADIDQEFVLSVQSGTGRGKGVGSGTIKVNGKQIVSLPEFGTRFKVVTKSLRLQEKNEISVEVAGETDAPIVVTIMSIGEHTVAAKVPPIGEAVDLEGYALIIFPSGTFGRTQDVTVSATASPSTWDNFAVNATEPRLPYEIRINTGDKAPKKDIEVSVNYPDSFFLSAHQIHIFAQIPDKPGASGQHDGFYMISSGLDDKLNTAKATLPKHIFSKRYGKNGTYEAIITVGLTH